MSSLLCDVILGKVTIVNLNTIIMKVLLNIPGILAPLSLSQDLPWSFPLSTPSLEDVIQSSENLF